MEDQRAHCTELLATNQPWHLIVFKREERWGKDSRIRKLNKTVGIILGFYFLGVVPLFGIALLEIGLLVRGWVQEKKIRLHAVVVACSAPRQQRRSFDGSHAAAYSGQNLSALLL